MKRLVLTTFASALCAVSSLAMPTAAELKKAQPLVVELMAPAMAEFKAAGAKDKSAAAVKVGDTSSQFANSAETEAAKFLLLKGAVNFYTRGEAYDKAADMVAALQANVKDVPPDVIAEITGKATGKISETKAPRLFAQYRAAKLQVRAGTEAKALAKKLKTMKSDALQRRYAEALAVSGNWKTAYAEFAKLSDAKLKAVVEAEAKGQTKSAESGEFWWSYEPSIEDADDFFKSHAAVFYRKALAAGEITGLKKNIVEQRIAGIAVAAVTPAASPAATGEVLKPLVSTCVTNGKYDIVTGSKSPFEVKGDMMIMKLENGKTVEFVKCPAGEVELLVDYEKNETRKVKITRPYWMTKLPFGGRETLEGISCFGDKPNWHKTELLFVQFEKFCADLSRELAKYLPKGYVFRLPSLAEQEHAYHAGNYEKWEVYGNVFRTHSEDELKAKANAWGIGSMWYREKVLDRIMPGDAQLAEKGGAVLHIEVDSSVGDFFFWNEKDTEHRLRRNFRDKKLECVSLSSDSGDWVGHQRLVIGPDLVSEWRAKKEGKGVSVAAVPSNAQSTGKAWQEKGNAATLDLGAECGKLEFVKCPAGSFKQLIDADMTKVRVEISRDFWIMKKPLTPRECAFVPQMRPAEADGLQILKRVGANRVAEYLSDTFAKDLPKNMVVRLPTAAEWEYAFLANTRDRKSPFYESYPGHNHRKHEFALDSGKLSKPNDWGLVFPKISELLLDVYPLDSVEKWDKTKDPDSHSTRVLPKSASTTDPFTWSESNDVVMLQKRTAGDPWQFYTDPKKTPFSCVRLVVGPDLVSEWKAKHGKK